MCHLAGPPLFRTPAAEGTAPSSLPDSLPPLLTKSQKDWGSAWNALNRWYQGAVRCRLEPIRRLAKTVWEHSYGVLRWFDSGVTNGILEGFASLVQAAKARARGYRSEHYIRLVIHLLLSKLDFRLPKVLGPALPT